MRSCAWCGAPRGDGPRCPKCDAIYAKAEALRAGASADPDAVAPPTVGPAPRASQSRWKDGWAGASEDLNLELRLRVAALPAALLIAFLCQASPGLHRLQRVFLSMMIHELGHAVTAWLCGFAALPSLWFTRVAEQRGLVTPILVAAGLAAICYHGCRARQPGLVVLGAALFLAQAVGTVVLSPRTARSLITFGGDGGGMVLGAALMATFFFGRDTQIYKGWLRWGFLVIGSAAFADCFTTWWIARRRPDVIPFGENEGVGPSDPSVLVDVYGWTEKALVYRYVNLGLLCLLVLAGVWIYGVLRTRGELRSPSRSSVAPSVSRSGRA